MRRMPKTSPAGLLALAVVLALTAEVALALDQLLPGRRLAMRDEGGAERTTFVLSSPIAPTPGGPDDPTVAGGTVQITNPDTSESATFPLPASGWANLSNGMTYSQVANVATEVETRTLGASVYQPALAPGRHSDVDPYFGIPAIPSFPFDGSALVVWDSGTPTPPTANTPNTGGSDPHGRPRSTPAARLQKSQFLKPDGRVVDVCGGMPCLAP